MKKFSVFFLVVLLSIPLSAKWSDAGHRLTGLIAYEVLDQSTRDQVLAAIKAHDYYKAHFENKMPDGLSAENQDRWIFSQIAIWPDLIKKSESKFKDLKRNEWHFLNEPVYLSNQDQIDFKGVAPTNLSRYGKGELTGDFKNSLCYEDDLEWNIAQAYSWVTYILKTAERGEAYKASHKAEALCWVFHLAGDIHQPLHSTGLFSKDDLPTGDAGGNLIVVKDFRDGRDLTLHSYWDQTPGAKWSSNEKTFFMNLVKKAQWYVSNLSAEGESAQLQMNFETWIMESHYLAISNVYVSEIKDAFKAEAAMGSGPYHWKNKAEINLNGVFKAEYDEMVTEEADKRVVHAGYRIAQYLTNLYK